LIVLEEEWEEEEEWGMRSCGHYYYY